jgi:hypothetical protein
MIVILSHVGPPRCCFGADPLRRLLKLSGLSRRSEEFCSRQLHGRRSANRVSGIGRPREGPVLTPDRASSQLKVCSLSFSELSAWRSNTWVAMPLKVAGLPSLSLPLALQLAAP